MFYQISKHLESRQYSVTRRNVNSFLAVWKCGQTQSLLFDVLLILWATASRTIYNETVQSTVTWRSWAWTSWRNRVKKTEKKIKRRGNRAQNIHHDIFPAFLQQQQLRGSECSAFTWCQDSRVGPAIARSLLHSIYMARPRDKCKCFSFWASHLVNKITAKKLFCLRYILGWWTFRLNLTLFPMTSSVLSIREEEFCVLRPGN